MLFNSVHYYAFAPVVILVFFLLPAKGQRWWLFVASLYFYAVFKVPFILILLASIVITYGSIRWMAALKERGKAGKIPLWVSVTGNLSLLYFFKYVDFSVRSYNSILAFTPCDSGYLSMPGVILPMGISFFTLQAISATVDVYRGMQPPSSFLRFSLYLSFFPQLVAGPIIRAKDILPQFATRREFTGENFRYGITKIAVGIFKKTFIADQIGNTVDSVFAAPGEYSWISLLISVYFHAIQIYCDFSGYSDIAIGTARILGYHIPENFNLPFFRTNMAELWRNWHVSFSSWLRDYVYIPLGGSKVSEIRAYINVFLTMVISGLWHGADGSFLIWGGIHGIVITFERYAFSMEKVREYWERIPAWIRMQYSFFIFAFTLFWFRARPLDGIGNAADVGWYMALRTLSFEAGNFIEIPWNIAGLMFLLFAAEAFYRKAPQYFEQLRNNWLLTGMFAGTILLCAFYLYNVTVSAQFIYFQF